MTRAARRGMRFMGGGPRDGDGAILRGEALGGIYAATIASPLGRDNEVGVNRSFGWANPVRPMAKLLAIAAACGAPYRSHGMTSVPVPSAVTQPPSVGTRPASSLTRR